MTREELIGSLRSCAELVKEHKLDACAAVMRAAAKEMEEMICEVQSAEERLGAAILAQETLQRHFGVKEERG